MAPRYLFFSGKGGVGKTTMACSIAVQNAAAGKRTLLVTTDPASNLADVFEQEIGHRVTAIQGVANLWAMEIEPDRATEEYRERVLAPFRELMPADVMAVLEEQFRSPCTTEMASFDRFVDFMGGDEYEVVIFDTAPTGHTIRLLELPVDWSEHIAHSARGSGQTCLGPVQAIQESKAKYDAAVALLSDPERTRFIFVLQPDHTAIFETERSARELERIGVRSQELIVNGLLPAEVSADPVFRQRREAQSLYLAEISSRFAQPRREVPLLDGEVKGLARLRAMAGILAGDASGGGDDEHVFPADGERSNGVRPVDRRTVRAALTPVNGHSRAVFFTGKGGVGKTTVSCLTALELARQGYRTLLLTTDPAAHLGETLGVPVGDSPGQVTGAPGLWAVRVDPESAAAEYRERVLAEARARQGPEMLAAIEEELESPCTVEMAAFEKFVSYLTGDTFEVVVFDTAPTGHTLRLLDLPFDYSRQVEMMVTTTTQGADRRDSASARLQEVIARLKDPARTTFAFVVYPEATPVVEAERAARDLSAAGIRTGLVVANQVIEANPAGLRFLENRRRMQARYLREIESRFGDAELLALPLLPSEARGLTALEEAGRKLYEGVFESGPAVPIRVGVGDRP